MSKGHKHARQTYALISAMAYQCIAKRWMSDSSHEHLCQSVFWYRLRFLLLQCHSLGLNSHQAWWSTHFTDLQLVGAYSEKWMLHIGSLEATWCGKSVGLQPRKDQGQVCCSNCTCSWRGLSCSRDGNYSQTYCTLISQGLYTHAFNRSTPAFSTKSTQNWHHTSSRHSLDSWLFHQSRKSSQSYLSATMLFFWATNGLTHHYYQHRWRL
jgi:hypothetical protein